MLHEKALTRARRMSSVLHVEGIKGRWVNRQGSILDLSVHGHDVTGTFARDDDGDQVVASLRGFATGGMVALVAFSEDMRALSSWTGELMGDHMEKLQLAWRVISEVPEPEMNDTYWVADYHGSEEFTRP